MKHTSSALAIATTAGFAITVMSFMEAGAADPQVERGKYLTSFSGCFDCHTPGYFFGKPDMERYLGGSEVGFEMPGLGVFVGPNLTPDKETGLGDWTEEDIVTALQKGVRPDGRTLAPIMPWKSFANLTDYDARAIAKSGLPMAACIDALSPLRIAPMSAEFEAKLRAWSTSARPSSSRPSPSRIWQISWTMSTKPGMSDCAFACRSPRSTTARQSVDSATRAVTRRFIASSAYFLTSSDLSPRGMANSVQQPSIDR